MSDSLPFVTVVIAARPGQVEVSAVAASRQLDYPRDRLEILVARGRQPAVQRNVALRSARGELIYFLDDDSLPAPDSVRRAVAHFADPQVQLVGGPNLCPPDAPKLEQAFAAVMGNWLAFGPSCARYAPVGRLRASSEKELILCNLVARRSAVLAAGGFDEALYPNEENALMDGMAARGGRLLYDPDLQVYRRPRSTLGAFVKMLLNYGRGRAEQFRLHPTVGSALNFIPPMFCLYLLLLPLLPPLLLWPLWIYLGVVGAQAFTLHTCPVCGVPRVLPLISLTHVCYGLGFWHGCFTRLKSERRDGPVAVTLETLYPA
jgi:succinoglycan biosynthesis protein ExoA